MDDMDLPSDIFTIDTTPTVKNDFIVPHYSKEKFKILTPESKENNDNAKQQKKGGNSLFSCWNCGSKQHAIRECKEQRNPSAIAKNRLAFQSRAANQKNRVVFSRYHIEEGQKYSHLKPGTISERLRQALGLSDKQLPSHIYNMRVLGYPPGWLFEAKVHHSGITLFDSQGQAVMDPDDEDGEVENDRAKYDVKKIIDFPGFNVLPPADTVDESRLYCVPPMSLHQSKEALIEELLPNATKAYKRMRMSLNCTIRQESPLVVPTEEEMEIVETPATGLLPEDDCRFIPPLPSEALVIPVPPDEEEGEIPSPTLLDLEQKKKLLMADFSDEAESTMKPTFELMVSRKKLENDKNGKAKEANQDVSKQRLSEVLTNQKLEQSGVVVAVSEGKSLHQGKEHNLGLATPLKASRLKNQSIDSSGFLTPSSASSKSSPPSSLGKVKSVAYGTPILKRVSPYSRLPSPECFSQNICDVINFENLPDSTGKYEQMSGILRKVRTEISRMNREQYP